MRLALACDGEPLADDLLRLLHKAGLPVAELRSATGPGLFPAGDVDWVLTAGADVLTMCELGAADAGIVGKERLLEDGADVFELLDLAVDRRRLVFAMPASATGPRRRLRVATRFPRATRDHWVGAGRDVRPLGMAEAPWLAVALRLADGVVELDGLLSRDEPSFVIRDVVAECSARLVAGRQARALHGDRVARLVDDLREAQGGE